MTRRITIARDGTVKLRGVKTRWRVETAPSGWKLRRPTGPNVFLSGCSMPVRRLEHARAYLESLTDEELLG